MASRSAELAFLIANEGGKPLVDARVEVARAIDGIDLCIKELLHHVGQEVPMGLTSASESRLAFSTREPLGIVVAVSAFNHPLNLIVHQVAPAVATGCPVLVKPADDTPLSCQLFVQILHEAGLPEEWCRYCPCELDTAQRLVVDPRIGFFSFVGSAKVGWMPRSKLAAGVRCSLSTVMQHLSSSIATTTWRRSCRNWSRAGITTRAKSVFRCKESMCRATASRRLPARCRRWLRRAESRQYDPCTHGLRASDTASRSRPGRAMGQRSEAARGARVGRW